MIGWSSTVSAIMLGILTGLAIHYGTSRNRQTYDVSCIFMQLPSIGAEGVTYKVTGTTLTMTKANQIAVYELRDGELCLFTPRTGVE